MSSIFVKGYLGLGDNIYLRPTIRELKKIHKDVFLQTPWPELFVDLDIFPVKPNCTLRTQRKNEDKYKMWHDMPRKIATIDPRYGIDSYKRGLNPCAAFEEFVPSTGFDFSMPTFLDERAREISESWGDFAIIRPCTVRTEWAAPARNCDWSYMHDCADILEGMGIKVIEIADVDDRNEWREGPAVKSYDSFVKGQLSPMLIASLMKQAVVTVAPVGFSLPMGIATNSNIFTIYGGYIPPEVMVDSRMDLSTYGYASPDSFCSCYNRRHKLCNKAIPNLRQEFTSYLKTARLPRIKTA